MSFLPVLHPLLLVPLTLTGLGVAVWALITARTGSTRLIWVVRVLLVAACALLAFRPGIPDGTSKSVATNVDVIIALDNTTSMLAEDWTDPEADGADGEQGRRIDGVRADVRALIEAYPGARFALIAFDNSAQVRLPLTTDTSALMSSLEVMAPPPTDNSSGSSIGVAADALAGTLENAASADGRARLVFYLGDGEQTASGEPQSFDASAPYVDGGGVLGYGTTEGGRMKRVEAGIGAAGGYIEDPSTGEPALSTIDEAALEGIAGELGVGFQLRTGDTEAALPEAPAETTTVSGEETPGAREELSWIVALVVAGLLAVEIGVATARVGRTLRMTRSPASRKEAR